jgi:hypothetical protein
MHMNTKRWLLAAGAAAAAWVSAPALAAKPGSGGPGGLGTEVPFDSRVARQYFNYYLPTGTPEAIQIRERVQRLHAGHQAAVELGRRGAASQSAEVRALAARMADEQGRIDWSLAEVCKDSLLALDGGAHDAAAQEYAEAVRDLEAAPAPERESRFVAAAVKLLEEQVALVDQLRPEAKRALRQQLGSVLEREHKLLPAQLAAARSLSAKGAGADVGARG